MKINDGVDSVRRVNDNRYILMEIIFFISRLFLFLQRTESPNFFLHPLLFFKTLSLFF